MTGVDPTRSIDGKVARTIGSRLLWPGMVFILMGVQFTLCGITFVVAMANPVQLVEEDYYRAGVDWDRRRAAETLGWEAVIEIDRSESRDGGRVVTVTLTDAAGRPVEGATGILTAFAHAAADRRLSATLRFDEGGAGRAELPIGRAGWWQVQLEAHRGQERFLATDERFIYPPATEAEVDVAPMSEPNMPRSISHPTERSTP